MSMTPKNNTLPEVSSLMALEEFIDITGITREHLNEIVALGWLETMSGVDQSLIFYDKDIYKVRKLERICCDFELPVIGGTIIVDLLERIDRLQRIVDELNNFENR